jgi:hypothetical protein
MPEDGLAALLGGQSEIRENDAHVFLRLYWPSMIEANASGARSRRRPTRIEQHTIYQIPLGNLIGTIFMALHAATLCPGWRIFSP